MEQATEVVRADSARTTQIVEKPCPARPTRRWRPWASQGPRSHCEAYSSPRDRLYSYVNSVIHKQDAPTKESEVSAPRLEPYVSWLVLPLRGNRRGFVVAEAAFDREPEDLRLIWTPQMSEIFDELDESDRRAFRDQVFPALMETIRTGSSRPLNETVDAWYRTLLFKRAGADKTILDAAIDVHIDEAEVMTFQDALRFVNS